MLLYKYTLCPISQKVLFLLKYFNVKFQIIYIKTGNDFNNIKEELGVSPLPMLLDNNIYLKGPLISEYLYAKYGNKNITIEEKFLENILDSGFYYEVYKNIVYEKTLKYMENDNISNPNTENINRGLKHLKTYLLFFEEYLQKNNTSNYFYFHVSFFCHLMCLDYCSYINWNQYEEVKKLYIKMKYNSIFQEMLKERISNFSPPFYYDKLNF